MITAPPASNLLRQRNGALTQELVQEPARFGLGKVPARLQPDATTDSVCGFCSTGCSLTVHLLRGGRLDDVTARRAIETIDRNAKIQTQLIADILDVSISGGALSGAVVVFMAAAG